MFHSVCLLSQAPLVRGSCALPSVLFTVVLGLWWGEEIQGLHPLYESLSIEMQFGSGDLGRVIGRAKQAPHWALQSKFRVI